VSAGRSTRGSASTTCGVDRDARPGSTITIANRDGDRTAVFAIELRAVSPHGQHRRAYEIHVGPDLFGQLVVAIDFGVIGTRGQRRVHLVADAGEVRTVVRWALRRRLTAPGRIGVPYRVIACYDPECWLELMGLRHTADHLLVTVPARHPPVNHPAALVHQQLR
jgi:hypothetical protein